MWSLSAPDRRLTLLWRALPRPAGTAATRLIRVVGLDGCDYLNAAEALALAGALTAAVDELAPPG